MDALTTTLGDGISENQTTLTALSPTLKGYDYTWNMDGEWVING